MTGYLDYLLLAPPILLALTIHECAHALAAFKLGDDTAKNAGRLTLNPLVHLDLIGTIMLFLIQLGWAKPVPVNPHNFRNPRTGMFWVALAGPASNLILAAVLGIFFRQMDAAAAEGAFLAYARIMLRYGIFINLILAFFNLIPIPPLDGSKILFAFIPSQYDKFVFAFSRYGPYILLLIILVGQRAEVSVIWQLIGPPVRFFMLGFAGIAI